MMADRHGAWLQGNGAWLQVTSDGKPKVLDLQDCTGAGDVAMSAPKALSEDGALEGIGGKLLAVNADWSNPTGQWRVGTKPLFELYPGGCTDRIKAKRKVRCRQLHRL
jgi:tripeptidyl-peptidase II